MNATILALATGALQLFRMAMEALNAARQRGEMSPEEEAQFDALASARMLGAAWQKSKKG